MIAQVINLNGRPTIRVLDGTRLVGYFANPSDINDHGWPVDLAELEVRP